MDTNESGLISMVDLGMAYRKAKADLFYSQRACKKALSAFEADLKEKLEEIKTTLSREKAPSVPEEAWTFAPKSIKDEEPKTDLLSSDPQNLWNTFCHQAEKNEKKVQAEFRLMEKLPIDFHVFSALWINKIGHKFEKKLTKSARGNRLRRDKSEKINLLSLGSTVPYLHAYHKWRDDAFAAMGRALQQDKSIVAITADVSSFYHKLDVLFMLNTEFISKIGVKLTPNEQVLHRLFIKALDDWAKKTPLKCGLPVGLTASSLIANVALFELDQLFEQEIIPLYYGRYVDDIILVMEDGASFKSSVDVWDWVAKRMKGALAWKNESEKKELRYFQEYLGKSEILFVNEKNKTFLLSGSSGRAILESIRSEINLSTSEWRSLPTLPNKPDQLESALLSAIQRDGASADSLRKADKVSVRRAEFALKLRDLEAYSRLLPPESWKIQRHAFLTSFIRHVLVLPTFFDFFNYLQRVVSLAVHCADFAHLQLILNALENMLQQLKACDCSIKATGPEIKAKNPKDSPCNPLDCFRADLQTLIHEAVESAFPLQLSRDAKRLWEEHFSDSHLVNEDGAFSEIYKIKIQHLKIQHRRYIKQDLAYRPLKQYLLPPALSGAIRHAVSRKKLANAELPNISSLLQDCIVDGYKVLAGSLKLPFPERLPSGLLFPVRPFGIHDLYLIHKEPFSLEGSQDIAKILLPMRGFKPEKGLPLKGQKPQDPIEISNNRDHWKEIRIAVTSWKTCLRTWIAAVKGDPDPDKNKWDRFAGLLNQVLQCRKSPDYIILPELSVPAPWFLAVVDKLRGKGISLICGIEYLHAPHKTVHNQVWAALLHDALGFPTTMIYRQDKQKPALLEERKLHCISGKSLKPQLKTWAVPPVINHGGFQFALLICSQLTNIAYRAALRGKVDALFIPEWNKDTETFNALVESAALDIHAYIIQCNDRQYGDSRIRAPYKDNWVRDLVRVKGGLEDYFVIGEIDVASLRAFQSSSRSPSGPFKPVPDGFEISFTRKALPSGERHE